MLDLMSSPVSSDTRVTLAQLAEEAGVSLSTNFEGFERPLRRFSKNPFES
ncbi:hypothetical protein QFZ70_003451 [Arthrobacter sp. V1I9]|nr:hypothetical protein [Arthrobacter sp. V1I9]